MRPAYLALISIGFIVGMYFQLPLFLLNCCITPEESENVTILIQAVSVRDNRRLVGLLNNFLLSLLQHTQSSLTFYIIAHTHDVQVCESVFKKAMYEVRKAEVKRFYLDAGIIAKDLFKEVTNIRSIFNGANDSYYDDTLFFIPASLHRIQELQHIPRIIMFDIDTQLRDDVSKLNKLFKLMDQNQIFGLAREQSPVYKHISTSYRNKHPKTRIGDPPPHGVTGFNSGVKLVKLNALRRHLIYNRYLDNPSHIKTLSQRYNFIGHLGDQDLYTLLSFEHMDMFYMLPCQWNRQLCTFWKTAYFKTYDEYHFCKPPFYLLHGNCKTKIPDDG